MERTSFDEAKKLKKGAYVVSDAADGKPDVVVIATGTEAYTTQQAVKTLEGEGVKVRLVSMPSWDLFSKQDEAYRESVLPKPVKKRVAVEAASPFGWERWTGSEGLILGIDRFGASAPMKVLQEKFGFTPEQIADSIRAYMAR